MDKETPKPLRKFQLQSQKGLMTVQELDLPVKAKQEHEVALVVIYIYL